LEVSVRKALSLGAAALLVLTLAAPVAADNFSQGTGANAAPNWKVYNYNSSGQAYATTVATASSAGIGFNFLSAPNTAFFMTGQQKDLLGDLSGKTITATFTISASSDPAFTYYGAPGDCGLVGPSVRLFFEGNMTGPLAYTKYWWSNPYSDTLASLVGNTLTLSVQVVPSNWSDWNGHGGSDELAGFAAAAADVSTIGLSFGGGCFFANGVGMSSGSASFLLTSYSVN
jgi:hypothetical protein